MSSVTEHYANLLAPVYTWMVGGSEAAFALGHSDLASVLREGSFAIDLGAGFGMHAIPLARTGWRVMAVDSSPVLLRQLAASLTVFRLTCTVATLSPSLTIYPTTSVPT